MKVDKYVKGLLSTAIISVHAITKSEEVNHNKLVLIKENKKTVGKLKKILAVALAFLITFQIVGPSSVIARTPSEDEIVAQVQESLLSKEATGFDIQIGEGQIETITNARGMSINLKYDKQGNLEKLTGDDIDVDISVYESGLVKSYKDNNSGKSFGFTYDENDNLTSVKNDDYHNELEFDEDGKPLELVSDSRLHFTSDMDDNGNVVSKKFGNGQHVDYSFVDDYLIDTVEEDGEGLYSFDYDENDRVSKIEYEQTGDSIEYGYDEGVIIEEYSNGTVIENEVNGLERVLSKEILSENGYEYDLRYNYDADDSLSEILTQNSAFKMTKDSGNSVRSITSDKGEVFESFENLYDGDVLTGYRFVSNNDVYHLVLDDDGFLVSISLNEQKIYGFSYDRLSGQLTSCVDYHIQKSFAYNYDDNGNLLSKTAEDLKSGEVVTAK